MRCSVCGGPVLELPDYGWVHVIDGEPEFPACNEGRLDSTGHVPFATSSKT